VRGEFSSPLGFFSSKGNRSLSALSDDLPITGFFLREGRASPGLPPSSSSFPPPRWPSLALVFKTLLRLGTSEVLIRYSTRD
jgi:hypothetical protein